MKARISVLFVLFFFCTTASLYGQSQTEEPGDLVLILDGSGSMWRELNSEHMIVSARKVLGTLVDGLPSNQQVGLIAYGHNREGDCSDIETLAPIGPLDPASLKSKIEAINPKGKTPITDSVNRAFDLLRERGNPASVILVSDGLETCSGDPCEAVKAAKESGIDFVMHVVGYGIAEENVAQLECTAQAGGGMYLPAESAEELASALDTAVETERIEGSAYLQITGIADDELADIGVRVVDPEYGSEISIGRTYTDPSTNPRLFTLEEGNYDVLVLGIGFKGDVRQRFENVSVTSGDTTSLVADFSTGELSVKVLRNGELSDAVININAAESGEFIVGARSYTSEANNPKVFSLTAGTYTLTTSSVEIENETKQTIENIVVAPNQRIDHEVSYESGVLKVGATYQGELTDVTVRITNAEGAVAQGRTYTSGTSNPKTFMLLPGTYTVTLKGLKVDGTPSKVIEVEVGKGETVEQMVEFDE